MQEKLILNEENFILFIKDLINIHQVKDYHLNHLEIKKDDEKENHGFIRDFIILDTDLLNKLNICVIIKHLIYYKDEIISDISEDLYNLYNDQSKILNNDFYNEYYENIEKLNQDANELTTKSISCKYFQMEFNYNDEDKIEFTYNIENLYLFSCINNRLLNSLKDLVENGAEINLQNIFSSTPLIYACQSIRRDSNLEEKNFLLEVVKYLVEKGADINIQDQWGNTALIYASERGHLEVVKYLVEKGADINHQNEWNRIALMWASQWGHLDIVKYLVQKGSDINHQDEDGYTALFLLINNALNDSLIDILNIVKYLVEKGADINLQTNNGSTALIEASGRGSLDIVQYLVEKGAKINIRDNWGHTALMWASWNGHLEVVKFLIDKGAIYNTSKIINGLMKYININEEEVTKLINYIIEKNNKTFSNL